MKVNDLKTKVYSKNSSNNICKSIYEIGGKRRRRERLRRKIRHIEKAKRKRTLENG